MQIELAREFILNKIKRELPAYFYYHNADHAVDVYTAASQIAQGEGIGEYDTTLLLTAALFHDAGFINGQAGHELNSCKIAQQHLPAFGYSNNDIEQICTIIMATKMPQTPHSKLGEIICDADLDYLGRNDFFILSKRLFSELVITDNLQTELEWDKLQVVFLEKHHYFTKTAINLRAAAKQQHLLVIKQKVTI